MEYFRSDREIVLRDSQGEWILRFGIMSWIDGICSGLKVSVSKVRVSVFFENENLIPGNQFLSSSLSLLSISLNAYLSLSDLNCGIFALNGLFKSADDFTSLFY